MGLFDVHAHLTHPELAKDVDGVLARARAAGVTSIISNGLNPADNETTLALAERDPLVRPALGFYPVDVVLTEMRAQGVAYPRESEHEATAEEGVAYLEANVERAFAVGEIGLDGYWVPEAFWAKQEEVFKRLVRLAMDADKAIIIHTRKREKRALELLGDLGATRVNWHCFGSKVKLARRIAEAGHYLSIPANARRSESFTRMLQTLPRDRILLETDCPYLGPSPGRTNEPGNVAGTLAYAAELWQEPPERALVQLEENYHRLFGQAP
ncbi:MAG: TatD family hydrolase [Myxococcales bacterium]|nr:TatD family hydrolase [Myxococcales bacterium]